MSIVILNKENAFASQSGDEDNLFVQAGLTKREYFAGLAMQGLLSNPSQIDFTNFEWIAQHAVGYADELLLELSKT